MTPAKTHHGERLGVSPPCRHHRRAVPRTLQFTVNRISAGLCFELFPTASIRDSQQWTRRADAQPLAESDQGASPAFQAQRADTSSAGGVSHRYATTTNSKAQRADTIQSDNIVCRPFGPLSLGDTQTGALRPRQRLCRPSRPESHSKFGHRLVWTLSTYLMSDRTRRADALPLAGGMFAS